MRNDHHVCPGSHPLGQTLVIEFAPEFRILFRRPLIQQEDRALFEQADNECKSPALPSREGERTDIPVCQASFCIQPELPQQLIDLRRLRIANSIEFAEKMIVEKYGGHQGEVNLPGMRVVFLTIAADV